MALKDKVIRLGFAAFRATGLHRLAGPLTRGRGAILMLHHVRPWRPPTPGFAPNRGLEVTPEFLDAALKTTRRAGFEFVTMDEALRRLAEGGAPFAALTFDDGYRDLRDFALPILERHQAPFTAYIATGYAARSARLWWLELEEAVRRLERIEIAAPDFDGALASASEGEKIAAFDHLYWRLRGGDEKRLLRVTGDLAARAKVDGAAMVEQLCFDWAELAELARHPLATIGAHTVHHRMLAKWPHDVARDEMAASKAELESALGCEIRHFAYPVGDPTSAGRREFALARELGFASAVTTRPGMLFDEHRGHENALPRLSISGAWQDIGYLEVLLSGAPFALWNRGRRLNVA
ncbi:MAG TPA: polysaccharide deacetylase family protein [Roseiarcus sp.]|nr:polysaccharide deacetylase family protein [Roseiarcus sp.]